MARQATSLSVTNSAIKSVLQSAQDISNTINRTTYYQNDPDLTRFPSGDIERTRQLNNNITKSMLALRNSSTFQLAIDRLNSSKEPLNKTDQKALKLLTSFSERADILSETGNIYKVASKFKFKSEAFAAEQFKTVLLNQERGGSIVTEAIERGAKSVGEVEKYAVDQHGFKRGNLPNSPYIQRLLDSKQQISKFSETDAGARQDLLETTNKFRGGNLSKDIEKGTYDALRRSSQDDKNSNNVGKSISAGLLGLGVGRLGEYGSTIGKSGVLEYAGFMKNTIGDGYDYGSPYANVIQQQSNRRQSTIGIISSAVGAGVGFFAGGPAGAFVGGSVGSQIGNIASSIGGSKDTLQAQAHAEYIQQSMIMQALINARPDVSTMLGDYGNIKGEAGVANILDVKTPTRMMIARGAITVNNDLSKKFLDSTTDEAIASNLTLAQSEDYGYNKALISRYAGGSKLDLGNLAKNADVSVGDLAQRTLDYVPFTRGNITAASEFAQKSFSQSSGYTARQLAAGSEGYLAVWQKDMIARQFENESYFDLINNKNGSLDRLGARANKLGPNADPTALAETQFFGIGPGDMQYVPPKRISKNVSPLFPAMSVESFMQTENPIRMSAYHGKTSQEDVNKSLQNFEGALNDSTVQLRTWTDTVTDYVKFIDPNMPKFPNVGPTGTQ